MIAASPLVMPRSVSRVRTLAAVGRRSLRSRHRLGVRRRALRRDLGLHDVDPDAAHAVVREHLGLDRVVGLGVIDQELLRVLATLPYALAVEREPRAALLDDIRAVRRREVDEIALARHALAVQDVELDLLERRRHLVLDDLDARAVADHRLFLLDRADAADVEADRRVELERVAAGRGLRRAE